jgi:hypothetical protein
MGGKPGGANHLGCSRALLVSGAACWVRGRAHPSRHLGGGTSPAPAYRRAAERGRRAGPAPGGRRCGTAGSHRGLRLSLCPGQQQGSREAGSCHLPAPGYYGGMRGGTYLALVITRKTAHRASRRAKSTSLHTTHRGGRRDDKQGSFSAAVATARYALRHRPSGQASAAIRQMLSRALSQPVGRRPREGERRVTARHRVSRLEHASVHTQWAPRKPPAVGSYVRGPSATQWHVYTQWHSNSHYPR